MRYTPIPADPVDVMLAYNINVVHRFNPEFHIERVGDNWYEFGTKKIHLAIINGSQLVGTCTILWLAG